MEQNEQSGQEKTKPLCNFYAIMTWLYIMQDAASKHFQCLGGTQVDVGFHWKMPCMIIIDYSSLVTRA